MVKTWVYENGVDLYEAGKVEHKFTDRHGTSHFVVWDDEEDNIPRVKVNEMLKTNCDCLFGVTSGVNGSRCPHEIAVDLFMVLKGVKGDFALEMFERDESAPEMKKNNKNELNEGQKKVLRDLLSCEICGSDQDMNLHRINRQGPYVLRNIMPLCDKHHKQLHSKEKGHH